MHQALFIFLFTILFPVYAEEQPSTKQINSSEITPGLFVCDFYEVNCVKSQTHLACKDCE